MKFTLLALILLGECHRHETKATHPHQPLGPRFACMCARSCPTFCDPLDCNPPDSSVHRILQARILAISFSRGPSWSRDQNCVSCISHISRQIVLSLSHLGSLGPRFVLHTITSLLRKRTKSQKTVNLQLYSCNVKTLYGTIFNPDSQQDICQQVKELNLATQP